jgi:hypothetical protein
MRQRHSITSKLLLICKFVVAVGDAEASSSPWSKLLLIQRYAYSPLVRALHAAGRVPVRSGLLLRSLRMRAREHIHLHSDFLGWDEVYLLVNVFTGTGAERCSRQLLARFHSCATPLLTQRMPIANKTPTGTGLVSRVRSSPQATQGRHRQVPRTARDKIWHSQLS